MPPRRRRLLLSAAASAAAVSSAGASVAAHVEDASPEDRRGPSEAQIDSDGGDFFDLSDMTPAELADLRENAEAMRTAAYGGNVVMSGSFFFGEEGEGDEATAFAEEVDGIVGGGVRGRRLTEVAGPGGDSSFPPPRARRSLQFDERPPARREKVSYTMDFGPPVPEEDGLATADFGASSRPLGKVVLGRKKPKPEERNRVNARPRRDFRCIDPDSIRVPCPPADLGRRCDKYNGGDFRTCYSYCKPSFCCIHDSQSLNYSPTCAHTERNCPSYFACYIVWWKLHDTVGPANYLRIAQDEPFYNVDFTYILNDLGDDAEFFQQLFGHHFDGDDAPGDDTFTNPVNW